MPSVDSEGQSPHDAAQVVDGWLIVDGCKVARVEPGPVIAFKDKCRRRASQRGTDQVRVTLPELEQALGQGTVGNGAGKPLTES